MKSLRIYAVVAGALLALSGVSVYAAVDQAADDENAVLGACLSESIQEKMPQVKESKIEECSNGEASALPKCLGMSDEDFVMFVTACKAQLSNAKCVAAKLKVPLIKYADCGYENDPEACYKEMGTSLAGIVKLSNECAAEGAK